MRSKKIHKYLLILVATLSFIGTSVVPVSAQENQVMQPPSSSQQTVMSSAQTTFGLSNPLKANSIGEVVLDFVQIFSYVVILLAVLALIYVGFQYVIASAQGASDKIKELHGYLLYIVIGIAIVIGARVIVQVVINTLSATGTVDSGIINSANNALKTP